MDKMEEMVPRRQNMSDPSEIVRPSPEETAAQDMEFPLAPDGIIPLYIQLMNETATLTIDVRNTLRQVLLYYKNDK